MLLGGALALLVAAGASLDLTSADLWTALSTLAAGYILSRGLGRIVTAQRQAPRPVRVVAVDRREPRQGRDERREQR